MLASGTVWHDGVLLAEVTPAETGVLRRAPGPDNHPPGHLARESLVKVFQEDVPPWVPAQVRVSAARNEKEPLQLRCPQPGPMQGIRIG